MGKKEWKFYKDPYAKSITSRVLDMLKTEEGYLYSFEDTIFYPGGGGQLPDTGYIEGQKVLKVFERDGRIYHLLPVPLECEECDLKIDWKRRYLFMKMHTGQHLLSAVFENLFGCKTLSSTIQEDYVSIELSTSKITWEEISFAEKEVLRLIQENRMVETYWTTVEEARKLPLRKFVEDLGERVRIVEIEGADISFCKGTHVKRTGEIGIIAVYDTDRVRGNARIYFRASEKALAQFQQWRGTVKEIVSSIAIEEHQIVQRLHQITEEKRELLKRIRKLEKSAAEQKLKEFLETKEPVVIDELNFEDEKALRFIVSNLFKNNKFAIIHSPSRKKLFLSIPEPSIERDVLDVLRGIEHRGGGRNGILEFSFQDNKKFKEAKHALQHFIVSKVKGG